MSLISYFSIIKGAELILVDYQINEDYSKYQAIVKQLVPKLFDD